MDYKDRIISDPGIMLGKPIIKGTRITVELILKKVSEGADKSSLLKMYPNLTELDLNASFNYASEVIRNEEIIDPN
jgi:uncharacterized protein (DUF433 family)